MASDRSQFGVNIMRFSVKLIKTLCGSVRDHPSLVAFLFFLIFLYRKLPFVFSLLISASPVLICTAVLLGTILSLGQPNQLEIEKEQSASFETEISKDAFVVERDDVVEDLDKETPRSSENEAMKVENVTDSAASWPAIEGFSTFKDRKFDLEEKERESADKKPIEDDRNCVMADEDQVEDGWSVEGMVDDTEGEQLDIFRVSPRETMRHEEADEEGDNGDYSLDSWSNCAESSSPIASMTDFIPKLNELHQISETEVLLQPSEISQRGFDADLEGSDTGNDEKKEPETIAEGSDTGDDEKKEPETIAEGHGEEGDNEYDDDDAKEKEIKGGKESHGEEGDNENDDEDAKEKEIKGGKEDETEAANGSTEDDEKSSMDPGTFELERNHRLESLIARRRSQKSIRWMAEGNLIHLDSADVPFNIPPISTARHTPFGFSRESYDDMGLPPCPGSAPSVLMPRRNPFDLPYEPDEEKPNLEGDGFQDEFPFVHPKGPVFKRYESFSTKPSRFGGSRQDTQDLRLRPFLAMERLANERASYYTFDRQLSELSESRISSVPDTESVSSWLEEDKKVNIHDAHQETELESLDDAVRDSDEQKNPSSEDVDPVNATEQSDNRNDHHDTDEIVLNGAETHDMEELGMSEVAETRCVDSDRLLTGVDLMPDIPKEEASRDLVPRFEKVEESGEPAQPSYGESQSNRASLIETTDDRISSNTVATDTLAVSTVEDSLSAEMVEPVSVFPTCSFPLDTENDRLENEFDRQEILTPVQDIAETPVSANAVGQNSLSEDTSPSDLNKHLLWLDKSIGDASSGDQNESQESSVASSPTKSSQNKTPIVCEDAMYKELNHVSQHLNKSSALHCSPGCLEVSLSTGHEIEEVDRGFQNELDIMEDFSVEEDKVTFEPEISRTDSYDVERNTEKIPIVEAASVENISSVVKEQPAESSGNIIKSKIAVEDINHVLEKLL